MVTSPEKMWKVPSERQNIIGLWPLNTADDQELCEDFVGRLGP